MAQDNHLHQYSHVVANLLRGGKPGALAELYQAIVNELKEDRKPDKDDIVLLLEAMGEPAIEKKKTQTIATADKQQVLDLIKAIMLLLEQDDFYQGAKSYHLNLMKREPINALERKLKTRNFADVFPLLK